MSKKNRNLVIFAIFLFTVLFYIFYWNSKAKQFSTSNNNYKPLFEKNYTIKIAINSDPLTLNPVNITEDSANVVAAFIFKSFLKYSDDLSLKKDLVDEYKKGYLYMDKEGNLLERKVDKLYLYEVADKKVLKDDKISKKILKIIPDYLFEKKYIVSTCEIKNKNLILKKKDYLKFPYSEFRWYKNWFWHDGNVLKVQDVVDTLNYAKNSDVVASNLYKNIWKITTFENGLRVVYYVDSSMNESIWTAQVLPARYLKNPQLLKSYSYLPVGLGPYYFKNRENQEKIVLEKFPKYQGDIKLNRIIIKIIPDQDKILNMLTNFQLDIAEISEHQYDVIKNDKQFLQYYDIYKQPVLNYTYLGFNMDKYPFNDRDVRRALTAAIDKNYLTKVILRDTAKPVWGPMPENVWLYNPNVEKIAIKYNLDWAKKIIKEKNLENYEVTILVNKGNTTRLKVANYIKSQWEKLGLKVKIVVKEWKKFLHTIDWREFQTYILGWDIGFDLSLYPFWHSSQIPDMKNGKFGFNSVGFSNKEVDKLLQLAQEEPKNRAKYYFKVQEIIVNECPYIFLYTTPRIYVVNKRIGGIKESVLGIYTDIEKWYIKGEVN